MLLLLLYWSIMIFCYATASKLRAQILQTLEEELNDDV